VKFGERERIIGEIKANNKLDKNAVDFSTIIGDSRARVLQSVGAMLLIALELLDSVRLCRSMCGKSLTFRYFVFRLGAAPPHGR
jgi:hypothetical protein